MREVAIHPEPSRLRSTLVRLEAGIATRRGALTVFVVAFALYGIESIWLPVVPGRDSGTYWRFYVQMLDRHSVFPMSMLFRTPAAPVVFGGSLDLLGGWGAEVVAALLFAGSVLAWNRTVLLFGRRAALLTTVALLLFPGYAILFHMLASDSMSAAAFALFAFALSRAVVSPTPLRFGLAGLAIAVAALSRPLNQALIVFAGAPLVLSIPWRRRLAAVAACAGAAILILGAWTVNNGVRYDDYTVARGGAAYLPFFRTFVADHIVRPDNGPASRHFALVVQRHLLTQQPYRGYGITLQEFFAKAKDREFEDAVNLSDKYWGWNSDYAILRKVGVEAIRTHPGAYARGVGHTFFRELWRPLFVALPWAPPPGSSPPKPAAPTSNTVVANGRQLPRPTEGDIIPAAHQGFFDTTPDRHIGNVWTSPWVHHLVFSASAQARRFDDVETAAGRIGSKIPPYHGNAWLTLQFSRSSKLFPPGLLWLVVGAAALVIRRPRRRGLALALAGAALLIVFVNALADYVAVEFGVAVIPALILLGAVGLLGDRKLEQSRA